MLRLLPRRLPCRPPRPLLGLLALAGALLVLLPGAAAAAPRGAAPHTAGPEDRVTFGIGPGGQAYIDQRASLRYTAPPGGQLLDRVAVFNQSDDELDFLLYATDARNNAAGDLAFRPRGERNSDLGAWITLGADSRSGRVVASGRSLQRITVPAQSRMKGIGKVVVPLRLVVPHDATPGDHAAGVVVALVSRGANGQSQNIELEQRVALRTYVRVAGEAKPGLGVEVVDTDYAGGSGLGLHGRLRVTYRVTNTGNVRLGARTALAVEGPFGLGSHRLDGRTVPELVPGGSATVTTDVPDVWPTVLGTVRVTVSATPAPSGDAVRLAPVSDSARFWAVTWQEVVLLLLLLALVLHRRVRRTRRRGPRHARPGDTAEQLVRAGAAVLAAALVVGAGPLERARAAELGVVEVSPTVGTDQTLFSGAIASTRCPRGTGDAFFTVDGPDLRRSTAFIGFGNERGTGYQSFRGASIANIRMTNAGSFEVRGTYTIRFSCVRASDGVVTDSYTRRLSYDPAGAGRFRVLGYPSGMPSYHPLPTPAGQQPQPTATPRPTGGASAAAGGPPSSTAVRGSGAGTATPSGGTRVAAGSGPGRQGPSGTREGGALWWVLGGGSLLAGSALLVGRRTLRRRATGGGAGGG